MEHIRLLHAHAYAWYLLTQLGFRINHSHRHNVIKLYKDVSSFFLYYQLSTGSDLATSNLDLNRPRPLQEFLQLSFQQLPSQR